MIDSCLLLFTSRSIEQMMVQGGSRAWVLDAKRARARSYVVCAWNSTGEYAENNAGRQHGEAYLVAPIAAVESAAPPEDPRRFIVRFHEFSRISVPDVWPHGQRNPVFYTTLRDIGIDADALKFTEVAASVARTPEKKSTKSSISGAAAPLTIGAAKLGLALQYGVAPEAIEIVIRG